MSAVGSSSPQRRGYLATYNLLGLYNSRWMSCAGKMANRYPQCGPYKHVPFSVHCHLLPEPGVPT